MVILAAVCVLPASAQSLLEQLKDTSNREVPSASRFNFSGSTDARYVDGQRDITPFNFNNQGTTGGVGTFTALRLHLFLDAQLSPRTSLFVKMGGGSPDLGRVIMDAIAVTTKLGEDWPSLQVGRFLNNFGRFPQRFLGPDNPLIGDPLLYTYVSSLSTTQVPANQTDLLVNRGRGVASRFAGYAAATRGQAIVSNVWYLNGLKLFGNIGDDVSYSAALTNDAISAANFFDPNDNKAVTLHVGWQPAVEWQIGASFSHAAYLEQGIFANPALLGTRIGDFDQQTFGIDADYTLGKFGVFAEYAHNSWDSPRIPEKLEVDAFFIEPRYKLTPGLMFVARYDAVYFHDIGTAIGEQPWDFDVFRIETGAHYTIERDLITKLTYQFNRTDDAPRDPEDDLIQAQLVAVF
jgi:hypothetical protein